METPWCQGNINPSAAPSGLPAIGARRRPGSCRVVDCMVDLRTENAMSTKYSLCQEHRGSWVLMIDGLAHRFCGQCSRIRSICLFDGLRRTCRNCLITRNAKRREHKRKYEASPIKETNIGNTNNTDRPGGDAKRAFQHPPRARTRDNQEPGVLPLDSIVAALANSRSTSGSSLVSFTAQRQELINVDDLLALLQQHGGGRDRMAVIRWLFTGVSGEISPLMQAATSQALTQPVQEYQYSPDMHVPRPAASNNNGHVFVHSARSAFMKI